MNLFPATVTVSSSAGEPNVIVPDDFVAAFASVPVTTIGDVKLAALKSIV